MKALLLKDGYVLCKQLKFLLLALIIFCVMPGLSASAFSMIYVIMLPITTLSYDERSKWNQLSAMMPYTTRQIVVSKYILGYIGAGCVALLSCISQILFSRSPIEDLVLSVLLMPCIGAIILALLLPVMIRLGTEKGRLAYILTVGLMAGVSAGLQPGDLPTLQVHPMAVFPVLLAAAAVINLLSIRLSVRFYEKQKG